jgi:hypothetical protein
MASAPEIVFYVRQLDLGQPAVVFDDADLPPIPSYDTKIPQVVSVGSQVAEFAASIPLEMRADVANTFLLAQLAADQWMANNPSRPRAWTNLYLAVLRKCGWLVETNEGSRRLVGGDGLRVHNEILAVIQNALGTAVQAASIILDVLKGLKSMSAGQPFITLFERASQRASAQLFQLAYVEGSNGGAPRIKMACYELEANASVTQILFFRLSSASAELESVEVQLSINLDVFQATRAAISEKVHERIRGNIMGIDIQPLK